MDLIKTSEDPGAPTVYLMGVRVEEAHDTGHMMMQASGHVLASVFCFRIC